MMNPMLITAYLCVLVGVFFVARASLLAVKVRSELPTGGLRLRWGLLIGLLVVFAACSAVLALTSQVNDQGRLFGAGAFALGAGLAFQTSHMALQTARHEKQQASQEEEKLRDPLTGLFTRSLFEERLQEEVSRAQRYQLPLSLLLIGLGAPDHPADHPALRQIGALLREKTRLPDIAARFEAASLALLLPNTPQDGACILAERLRQSFETGEGAPQARVGVSVLETIEKDGKELKHRAEVALAKAGEAGQSPTLAYHPSFDKPLKT